MKTQIFEVDKSEVRIMFDRDSIRFIVFGDIHGEEVFISRLENYLDTACLDKDGNGYTTDAVFIIGDICERGTVAAAKDVIDVLKKRRLPVFAVQGNVDPKETKEILEKEHISVDKRMRIFEPHRTKGCFKILGLGGRIIGPGEPLHASQYSITEDEAERFFNNFDIGNDTILLTHFPPYKHFDMVTSGKRIGSKTLLRVIEKRQPLLSISGHVHEQYGSKKIGRTAVVNVRPAKELWITVVNIHTEYPDESSDSKDNGFVVDDVNFIYIG